MGALNVVDIAAVVLVKAHDSQSGTLTDWNVHKAFGAIARVTALNLAGIKTVTARKFTEFGLVSDDTHSTRLGVGTKGCALRPRQNFNTIDVINVRV